MTKQIFGKLLLCCMVAVATVFSSHSLFAQTGPAGGHDEIVKRLQAKLAAINNEPLTSEITPILNESGEADLGAKLLETFLLPIRRAENIVPEFAEENAMLVASKKLELHFFEMDLKATMLQTYYDALQPAQRTAWTRTALARMNSVSKPTVDNLKDFDFVRPAAQIESYKTICFKSNEDILKQIQQQNNNDNLETRISRVAEQMKKLPSSDSSDSYDDSSSYGDESSYESEGSSEGQGPPPKLPELTWVQQIEGLALGTADVEQIMPLCQLLAKSMESQMENKRMELNKLRPTARRSTQTGYYNSDYSESSDMSNINEYTGRSGETGSSPSFRSGTSVTMPLTQANVAAYLNSEVRMFMARNLKTMIVPAKTVNDKETLTKAWCALSEGANFSDVYYLVLMQSSAMEVEFKNIAKALELQEMLSVLSGYNEDVRVISTALAMAIANQPDLCIQMCFNIGKSVLDSIQVGMELPIFTSQAKVTLIEAVQYIGNPDAAEFLIPLLVDRDKAIVDAAADAIGAIGDSRASKTLVKGLSNPRLAEVIIRILKKMGSNSQNDIIAMFKDGNPEVDKFCVDILHEGGDLNALPALSAVLRRYHNALSTKDLPQSQKSEILMLTMRAGVAIISRNMSKAPPALTVPVLALNDKGELKLDYSLDITDSVVGGMQGDMMGPGMVKPDMYDDTDMAGTDNYDLLMSSSSDSPSTSSGGADGTSNTATMVPIEKMTMQLGEVQNNGPYLWLEMIYMVAAKHIADSSVLMESVRTENSGRVIGTTIRTERVDREFFRKVLNTSEEGLSAYLLDEEGNVRKNDVRKLKTQKERVASSLGKYKKQESRMGERPSSLTAFKKAVSPNPENATTATGEAGIGTTPQKVNPLGSGF